MRRVLRAFSEDAQLTTLLGHAVFYKLLSGNEQNETTPRTESTLPCYMYSFIKDADERSKLDRYVVHFSDAMRRGSIILNLVAQQTCGPRLQGAGDVSVAVWRPRYGEGPELQAISLYIGQGIGNRLLAAVQPEPTPFTLLQQLK
jgi:hypothetical protein